MVQIDLKPHQAQLRQRQWFLGATISALPADDQDTVLHELQHLAGEIEARCGVRVAVPALVERPGARTNDEAVQLNAYLRKAMFDVDLFVVLLFGTYSNGVAYELSMASEYAVPTVICTQSAVTLPETYERGELRTLARFRFEKVSQFASELVDWLTSNSALLHEIGERRDAVRQSIAEMKIASVLEKAAARKGQLSLDQIGNQSGLSTFVCGGGLEGQHWMYGGLTLMELLMWSTEADVSLIELLYANGGGLRPRFDLLVFEAVLKEGGHPLDVGEFALAADPRWKDRIEKLPTDRAKEDLRIRVREWMHTRREPRGNGSPRTN